MTILKTKNMTSLHIDETHDNTSQELISITADKLKLILLSHLADINSAKEWQMPLSLLITIILVLCTADFKKALGIPAEVWTAIFLMSSFGCTIWLIYCLFKIKKNLTLDQVIEIIKNKISH